MRNVGVAKVVSHALVLKAPGLELACATGIGFCGPLAELEAVDFFVG